MEHDDVLVMARPAVIIANTRTGGTFLSHCLSNHPRIFCDRGESLNGRHVWYRLLSHDLVKILDAMTHQPFYHVSMCKLTYSQAFEQNAWKYIVGLKPHIIHLVRRNVLRQVVSAHVNNTSHDRAAHSFTDIRAARVALPKSSLFALLNNATAQVDEARKRLLAFPNVLELEYEKLADYEIVDGAMTLTTLRTETSEKLCQFLGVPIAPMTCELRPVNPQPLPQIISNWAEVEAAVRASPFAYCLDMEGAR